MDLTPCLRSHVHPSGLRGCPERVSFFSQMTPKFGTGSCRPLLGRANAPASSTISASWCVSPPPGQRSFPRAAAAKATRAAASATVRILIPLFLAGLVVTCTAVDARLRVEVDCLRHRRAEARAAERANAHDERVGAQKLRTRPEQRRCQGKGGRPTTRRTRAVVGERFDFFVDPERERMVGPRPACQDDGPYASRFGSAECSIETH